MSIDAVTMLIGFAVVVINIVIRFFKGHKPCISRGKCASDLLNGVTLVPFFVMLVSVFSATLLQELIKTNMVLLSTAGGIGGFFALGEILKVESHKNIANSPSAAKPEL
ncbi:MAG: hypothetical protein ACLPOA_09830 [Methylocella sp.]